MAVSIVTSGHGWAYAKSGGVAGKGGGANARADANYVLAGDLLIGVIGSSRQYASVSTGWTQIASIGSGSAWLAAFSRVADGTSNDELTVTLSSAGSYAMAVQALRAPLSFDANSVESHQENTAAGSGASYALGTTLSGVNTGELSIMIGGGHGATDYLGNTVGVSGASWSSVFSFSGPAGIGPCAGIVAQCPTTGTPAVPSVTFNDTTHTFGRFIFGAVIKEGAATAGHGLFWGMH